MATKNIFNRPKGQAPFDIYPQASCKVKLGRWGHTLRPLEHVERANYFLQNFISSTHFRPLLAQPHQIRPRHFCIAFQYTYKRRAEVLAAVGKLNEESWRILVKGRSTKIRKLRRRNQKLTMIPLSPSPQSLSANWNCRPIEFSVLRLALLFTSPSREVHRLEAVVFLQIWRRSPFTDFLSSVARGNLKYSSRMSTHYGVLFV